MRVGRWKLGVGSWELGVGSWEFTIRQAPRVGLRLAGAVRSNDMEARGNGRRETRLLLVTIAISAAMLFLLARFRFPEEAAIQPAATAPAALDRLTARAAYDELAGIMAEVERRIIPSVEVVPIQTASGMTTYLPAVRITPDRAITLLAPGERVTSSAGGEAPVIVARDVARNLVVLQVASRPGDIVTPRGGTQRPGPRYVVVVDATSQGAAVRPVYVGRTDLFQDPGTGDSMLSIASVQQTLSPGSAIFTLDATFVGLALESSGLVTVQPAQILMAAAETAPPASTDPGDLGITVQSLSAPLARAASAQSGVIVSHVDPRSAAAARVRPTDVIQAINGVPVTGVAAFHQMVSSREPGALLTLSLSRMGQPVTETVAIGAEPAEGGASENGGGAVNVGLILQTIRGAGAEVLAADPGTAAGGAGLRAGDLVVRLGDKRAPEAGDILKAYAAARAGDALLLTVRRGTQHLVLALEKP